MIIDPFTATLAVAQAGMGIASGFSQKSQAAKEGAYNAAFQNAMTDAANRRTEQNYGRTLGLVQEQFGLNREAAGRAYSAEQIRMQELFSQAAFQQQGALQNLVEMRGTNNAMERYGRSAQRVNLISTLGQFGRNQALQAESLASAQSQSRRNLDQTSRDLYNANMQSWQQVAIAPTLQTGVPMPQVRNSMNDALMIGNSLMQGLGTYSSLKPPSAGSLGGFNYGSTKMGSGAGNVGGVGTFGPNYGYRIG